MWGSDLRFHSLVFSSGVGIGIRMSLLRFASAESLPPLGFGFKIDFSRPPLSLECRVWGRDLI